MKLETLMLLLMAASFLLLASCTAQPDIFLQYTDDGNISLGVTCQK